MLKCVYHCQLEELINENAASSVLNEWNPQLTVESNAVFDSRNSFSKAGSQLVYLTPMQGLKQRKAKLVLSKGNKKCVAANVGFPNHWEGATMATAQASV